MRRCSGSRSICLPQWTTCQVAKLIAYTLVLLRPTALHAHEQTLDAFLKARRATLAAHSPSAPPATAKTPQCRLTLKLVDSGTGAALAGLVRVTDLATEKAVLLSETVPREEGWHSIAPATTVLVPRGLLRVEALHGLEMTQAEAKIDTRMSETRTVELSLTRFYNTRERGWRSGNTHVHLSHMTRAEADRYLRLVSRTDACDILFVSNLRRLPDEKDYISNEYDPESLAALSGDGVLLTHGEEHRHNFGRGGEGFGHVMLLDIVKLIRPVSIGPGIMFSGTDGIPLQRGILEARQDGATIVWCHNTLGFEDIPNWVTGLVHAQNIFDGGHRGSYKDTFYRYLNLGLRVPFSTGTDWTVYDFHRAYVPVEGTLTSRSWLAGLQRGASFITNGPLLEFHAAEKSSGDTVQLELAHSVKVEGRGVGRIDFEGIELIYNGKVIESQPSRAVDGHFEASIATAVQIPGPGWLALRIPLETPQGELGRPLFAHTSPIYFEVTGKRVFDPAVANELIQEINDGLKVIEEKAVFANESERRAVDDVHRRGIAELRRKLKQAQ